MNIDRRLDCYCIDFGRGAEQELLQEVKDMEENSDWVPGIVSSAMELEAIDGPLFAKDVSDRCHVNYELALDTADSGSKLILNTGYEYKLLRETARTSLCETAKLFGSALGRMTPYLFSETINNGLHVAKGTTLMLMRYGKASALHSNAEGGYQVMPISELLKIVINMIQKRFGTGDFIRGYNSHSLTTALWELPDAQDRILKVYQNALNSAGVASRYPVNYMPAIRFASSDTAACCATLDPVFYVAKTNVALTFVDGVRIKHTKRGQTGDLMELFAEQADGLFAKFEESADVIAKLASIEIHNGCNAVVSLCSKFGIAKKYGEAARVEMEHLTAGGSSVTAHDLYICMSEAVAEAERCNASPKVIRDMEEALAKIPRVDWAEHDRGGIVAW